MWRGFIIVGLWIGPAFAVGVPAVAEPEVTPARVQEVAPGNFVRAGVHALIDPKNEGGIANIGFIVGSEAVAVIDSGGSLRDGQRLRAAIRARTDLPIRYVINTHMHPDHIFGNGAFVGDKPRFVGHSRLARAMLTRGAYYLEASRRLLGPEAIAGTEVVVPAVPVEDSLTLDLGQRRLRLMAYPTAHTDNDLTVLDEWTGTLWTGDLLFIRHLPVVDGSLKGWLGVMDSLATLTAARAVPGHGPASAPWPEALGRQRAYLTKLAADLRVLIAEGETMRQASMKAGQTERRDWVLFDEFNPRNATAGFAELEWE